MSSNTKFAGGNGTEESPYLISKPEHLNNIRKHMNFKAYFKQISDIDLSKYSNDKGWVPIGSNFKKDISNKKKFFEGVYDGNGYEISNLYIEKTENDKVGLFSALYKALIVNVNITNAEIYGGKLVGGIAGINNGYISNCKVEGSIMGVNTIGGLCGFNNNIVSKCIYKGTIYADKKLTGGIVGKNNGKIKSSQCSGEVYGSEIIGGIAGANCGEINRSSVNNLKMRAGEYVGGISGVNSDKIRNKKIDRFINIKRPKIYRCWACVDISGVRYLGGLVAYNVEVIRESYSLGNLVALNTETDRERYSLSYVGVGYVGGAVAFNSGIIENCYSAGSISIINKQNYNIGGLVGNNKGEVKGSYYDKDKCKQDDRDKGIPKTTEEMMLKSTFEPTWQFAGKGENILKEIWVIKEGETYPYLIWHKENKPTPKVL